MKFLVCFISIVLSIFCHAEPNQQTFAVRLGVGMNIKENEAILHEYFDEQPWASFVRLKFNYSFYMHKKRKFGIEITTKNDVIVSLCYGEMKNYNKFGRGFDNAMALKSILFDAEVLHWAIALEDEAIIKRELTLEDAESFSTAGLKIKSNQMVSPRSWRTPRFYRDQENKKLLKFAEPYGMSAARLLTFSSKFQFQEKFD